MKLMIKVGMRAPVVIEKKKGIKNVTCSLKLNRTRTRQYTRYVLYSELSDSVVCNFPNEGENHKYSAGRRRKSFLCIVHLTFSDDCEILYLSQSLKKRTFVKLQNNRFNLSII